MCKTKVKTSCLRGEQLFIKFVKLIALGPVGRNNVFERKREQAFPAHTARMAGNASTRYAWVALFRPTSNTTQ